MLAARFPGILPQMTQAEALQSAAVQSLDGSFNVMSGKRARTARRITPPPAWRWSGAAAIRVPAKYRWPCTACCFSTSCRSSTAACWRCCANRWNPAISRSRAPRAGRFPAQFQLVAAMNPCPCGYLGHYNGKCRCTPDQVARYRSKISGPLLDRIDIQIEVPAVPQDDLVNKADGEASNEIQARVEIARQRQLARQDKANAQLTVTEIDALCSPDEQGSAMLQQAISRLNLSARAYHRILKVARSIADLEGANTITAKHIAEAVQYRRLNL